MSATEPAPRTAPPLVEVEGLQRVFDVSPPWLERAIHHRPRLLLRAVDGVDFRIERGRTFGLVGESGCGKSTVARLIVGLYPPSAGTVRFDGVDLAALRSRRQQAPIRRRLQMIFQDPYASLNPRWRVRDIVAEPLRAFRLVRSRRELRERVGALLAQVGLSAADGEKYPHEFSGGQRQRISIARAISSEPEFLVCDEPTSALDVSVQAQILNLMKDLQRRLGLTYLFISHNLGVVYHVCDEVAVMYLGRLCEVASPRSLFREARHPYTQLLLKAVPRLDVEQPLEQAAQFGEVPNPLSPPPGCAFHTRCPFAEQRCREEVPRLLPAGEARVACHGVEEGRVPPMGL